VFIEADSGRKGEHHASRDDARSDRPGQYPSICIFSMRDSGLVLKESQQQGRR
jgi:hypothetical protein